MNLHDFFLYYIMRFGYTPSKIYRLAKYTFDGDYDKETIYKWLRTFYWRFFAQQFKRSCLPDGPKVGSVALSPRGDWRMPSDASVNMWIKDIENIEDIAILYVVKGNLLTQLLSTRKRTVISILSVSTADKNYSSFHLHNKLLQQENLYRHPSHILKSFYTLFLCFSTIPSIIKHIPTNIYPLTFLKSFSLNFSHNSLKTDWDKSV